MESAAVHSSEVHEVDFRIPPSPFAKRSFFRKPTFNSLFDPFGSPSRGQKPQEREDVTALRCSEPLRYKVGGASKPSPCFAGWDRRAVTGVLSPLMK